MSITVLILLLSVASAAIAYEWVYSDLKRFLWLDREYPLLKLLTSAKAYKRLVGRWYYPFFPLILPIMVISFVHGYLYKLSLCIYCSAFWVGFLFGILFKFSLPMVVVIAGLSVFAQTLNNFIKMKSL